MEVWHFPFVKPLDTEALEQIAARFGRIVTVEDGCLAGGLYGAVSEWLCSHYPGARVQGVGIPDEFVTQASQARQRAKYGLDAGELQKIFEKFLEITK